MTLGDTGLHVSPLCLGVVDDPATVEAAYDAGINFFFLTSDMHWPLYEGLRRGLTQLLERDTVNRCDIVVAAATYVAQPEFLWAPFEEVIAATRGLERIDVLVSGGTYQPDLEPRLEVLAANRDRGLVGAVALGASFHDRAAAREAIESAVLDIAFVRYNASHPGALADLFPHIGAAHRPLVFNFKTTNGFVQSTRLDELNLPSDLWRPTVQDHYRFALSRSELDGVLCAPRTPEQVDAIVAALERGPMSAEDEHYLIKLALLANGHAELST